GDLHGALPTAAEGIERDRATDQLRGRYGSAESDGRYAAGARPHVALRAHPVDRDDTAGVRHDGTCGEVARGHRWGVELLEVHEVRRREHTARPNAQGLFPPRSNERGAGAHLADRPGERERSERARTG